VLHTSEGLAVLKDQRPLIALNMELTGGWSLAEFVHYLDGFTYTPATVFPRRASEVVELAFRGDVTLPSTTLVRSAGGWERVV
jgi:hypothetical protein